MAQKVITSSTASGLNSKIEKLIAEGWKPVGEHKVVNINAQNRFSGMQHQDTIYEVEYSQTMAKKCLFYEHRGDVVYVHDDVNGEIGLFKIGYDDGMDCEYITINDKIHYLDTMNRL